MCGIAGIVDFSGQPIDQLEAALDRMDAAIAHRGPDGQGRAELIGGRIDTVDIAGSRVRGRAAPAATVLFAHRRLAVIDLSPGGRQPQSTKDDAAWLIYNGELYNYQTLRARRERAGGRFATGSDTEVLLDLLHRDGVDSLDQLRGMFAFAWWDERASRLHLARDPFGIKPLAFACPSPGFIAFASEPRALVAGGFATGGWTVGERAAMLERGTVDGGRSIWRGVEIVGAGERIAFDAKSLERRTYWSASALFAQTREDAPVALVAPRIRDAIVESVDAHFVSDVPVGIFLSGGLDSTAILAAARHARSSALQTFTVTMSGSDLDEGAAAREAAAHFGSEHRELSLTGLDVDAALDAFFAAMQEPTVDGFNTYLVARAARAAGLTVALSGVGGDEMLGGYPSFVDVPSLARMLAWAGPALAASRPLWNWWPSTRIMKLSRITQTKASSLPDLWRVYRGVWPGADARAITGESAVRSEAAHTTNAFDAIRALECREFLERQLLRDADTFTMCHALELRTPFVDRAFAEQVAAAGRWPRGGAASYKSALFAAMPDLTMPGRSGQPKRGFVLPMDAWIRTALSTAQPPCMADVRRRLRIPRYAPWVEQFLARRLHWSRLWALYVLNRFCDQHERLARENGRAADRVGHLTHGTGA